MIDASMGSEEIAKSLSEQVKPDTQLGGTLKFDLGEDGTVFLDGREAPACISADDKAADCTLICTKDTMVGLLTGALDGMAAFMSGRIRSSGNIGLATKLDSLFK